MAGFPTGPMPGLNYDALFAQMMAQGQQPQQQSPQFVSTGSPNASNMFQGATGVGAMFGPWGAAAGLGLEMAGGMMAANAGVSRRTVRRRGRAALQSAQSRDQLFGGLERAELMKGQAAEKAGFKGARQALDLGGVVAKQGLQTAGGKARSNLEQSVVSKGLLGTSKATQDFAGISDQYAQQSALIDMQMAQAFAQLGLQEAGVAGQHGRELSGLAAKDRAQQQSYSEAEFNLLTMA